MGVGGTEISGVALRERGLPAANGVRGWTCRPEQRIGLRGNTAEGKTTVGPGSCVRATRTLAFMVGGVEG